MSTDKPPRILMTMEEAQHAAMKQAEEILGDVNFSAPRGGVNISDPGTELILPHSGGKYREWFIDQFLDKAEVGSAENCWSWTGSSAHGYGYLIKQRRKQGPAVTMRVHRLAYELSRGVFLTRAEYVHHTCKNRACYNPAHLSLTDAHRHMAEHHRPTHCKYGHEYTPENTYFFKNDSGNMSRACRACHRRYDRRRYSDPEWRARKLARMREVYRQRKDQA